MGRRSASPKAFYVIDFQAGHSTTKKGYSVTTRRRFRPDWRPRAASTATSAVLDEGEVVVYCERTERMHCLNRSASVVWALCDGSRDVACVVRETADIAGADPDAVRAHVEAAVVELRELGILR